MSSTLYTHLSSGESCATRHLMPHKALELYLSELKNDTEQRDNRPERPSSQESSLDLQRINWLPLVGPWKSRLVHSPWRPQIYNLLSTIGPHTSSTVQVHSPLLRVRRKLGFYPSKLRQYSEIFSLAGIGNCLTDDPIMDHHSRPLCRKRLDQREVGSGRGNEICQIGIIDVWT